MRAMVNEVRDKRGERRRGDETKHKILTASFSSISKLEIKWRWILVSKRSSTPRCPRFTLESSASKTSVVQDLVATVTNIKFRS